MEYILADDAKPAGRPSYGKVAFRNIQRDVRWGDLHNPEEPGLIPDGVYS